MAVIKSNVVSGQYNFAATSEDDSRVLVESVPDLVILDYRTTSPSFSFRSLYDSPLLVQQINYRFNGVESFVDGGFIQLYKEVNSRFGNLSLLELRIPAVSYTGSNTLTYYTEQPWILDPNVPYYTDLESTDYGVGSGREGFFTLMCKKVVTTVITGNQTGEV